MSSGLNPTLATSDPFGWISEGYFGLDQGLIVLMIENYRSGLLWKLFMSSPEIQSGLVKLGYESPWLKK